MANKGEHSEMLALLRILQQGKVQVASADGSSRQQWLNVASVVLPDSPHVIFEILPEDIRVRNARQGASRSVSRLEIGALADSLFAEISKAKGASFKCRHAVIAAKALSIRSRKASCKSKSDLILFVASPVVGAAPIELGFSIKSEIGGMPTLLNAGATLFEYSVNGPDGSDALNVQEAVPTGARRYPGPKKLIPALRREGCTIFFEHIVDEIFESNLKMIDTSFPVMMAGVLLYAYESGKLELLDLLDSEELARRMSSLLKLPVRTAGRLLRYKFKELLRQSAIGMNPGEEWEGGADAHGGWIVVKSTGQLVCFHLVNDEDFREFLLSSCRIETPSMIRHKAGYLYRERASDSVKLRLCLQVRFGA